jgi:hypothetical protein
MSISRAIVDKVWDQTIGNDSPSGKYMEQLFAKQPSLLLFLCEDLENIENETDAKGVEIFTLLVGCYLEKFPQHKTLSQDDVEKLTEEMMGWFEERVIDSEKITERIDEAFDELIDKEPDLWEAIAEIMIDEEAPLTEDNLIESLMLLGKSRLAYLALENSK